MMQPHGNPGDSLAKKNLTIQAGKQTLFGFTLGFCI
jgi:hypothetical protein